MKPRTQRTSCHNAAKNILQEKAQQISKDTHSLPQYLTERYSANAEYFISVVHCDVLGGLSASGIGKSKREAELLAATEALVQLGYPTQSAPTPANGPPPIVAPLTTGDGTSPLVAPIPLTSSPSPLIAPTSFNGLARILTPASHSMPPALRPIAPGALVSLPASHGMSSALHPALVSHGMSSALHPAPDALAASPFYTIINAARQFTPCPTPSCTSPSLSPHRDPPPPDTPAPPLPAAQVVDYKSRLQTYAQQQYGGIIPAYTTGRCAQGGFISRVCIPGVETIGMGHAASKKQAEKNAASQLLEVLQAHGLPDPAFETHSAHSRRDSVVLDALDAHPAHGMASLGSSSSSEDAVLLDGALSRFMTDVTVCGSVCEESATRCDDVVVAISPLAEASSTETALTPTDSEATQTSTIASVSMTGELSEPAADPNSIVPSLPECLLRAAFDVLPDWPPHFNQVKNRLQELCQKCALECPRYTTTRAVSGGYQSAVAFECHGLRVEGRGMHLRAKDAEKKAAQSVLERIRQLMQDQGIQAPP